MFGNVTISKTVCGHTVFPFKLVFAPGMFHFQMTRAMPGFQTGLQCFCRGHSTAELNPPSSEMSARTQPTPYTLHPTLETPDPQHK